MYHNQYFRQKLNCLNFILKVMDKRSKTSKSSYCYQQVSNQLARHTMFKSYDLNSNEQLQINNLKDHRNSQLQDAFFQFQQHKIHKIQCKFCSYTIFNNQANAKSLMQKHINQCQSYIETKNSFLRSNNQNDGIKIQQMEQKSKDIPEYQEQQSNDVSEEFDQSLYSQVAKFKDRHEENEVDLFLDSIQKDKLNRKTIKKGKIKTNTWVIFEKISDFEAYCKICNISIRHHDIRFRKLKRHIKKYHSKFLWQNQLVKSTKFSNHVQNKSLQKPATKVPLKLERAKEVKEIKYLKQAKIVKQKKEFKVIDKSEGNFNNQNLRISQQLRQSHSQEDQSQLSELQKKMNWLRDIYYIEIYAIKENLAQKSTKGGYLLISKIMAQKIKKYQNCISFWYGQQAEKSKDFASILYIVSQDQHLCPVVLGIGFLIKQSPQIIIKLFQKCFKQLSISSQDQLAFCVPKFAKKLLIQNGKADKKCLFLQNQIIFDEQFPKIYSLIGNHILEIIAQIPVQQINQKKETKFSGFTLSLKYIVSILLMIREVQKNYDLINFLVSHFEKQMYENKIKRKDQSQNTITDDYLMNLFKQQILDLSELKALITSLSKQVYVKFCYCCVYGFYSLYHQQKNKNQYWVRQKRKKKIFESINEVFIVFYELKKKKWLCTCRILQLVGLPCPHIVRILLLEGKSLVPYIDDRWFIYYLDKARNLNSKSKILDIIKQNNKQFNNLWFEIDKSKFLQMFWS